MDPQFICFVQSFQANHCDRWDHPYIWQPLLKLAFQKQSWLSKLLVCPAAASQKLSLSRLSLRLRHFSAQAGTLTAETRAQLVPNVFIGSRSSRHLTARNLTPILCDNKNRKRKRDFLVGGFNHSQTWAYHLIISNLWDETSMEPPTSLALFQMSRAVAEMNLRTSGNIRFERLLARGTSPGTVSNLTCSFTTAHLPWEYPCRLQMHELQRELHLAEFIGMVHVSQWEPVGQGDASRNWTNVMLPFFNKTLNDNIPLILTIKIVSICKICPQNSRIEEKKHIAHPRPQKASKKQP